MVMRPGVIKSSNALWVISIQLGMPCGRQWLRTRKGRPAFSSEIICWICGRISGFQGGIFTISWRFWSLTSGIQTPLKSGWAAEAREATDVPSSPVKQQIIADFFATVFTVTNRWGAARKNKTALEANTWQFTEQFRVLRDTSRDNRKRKGRK